MKEEGFVPDSRVTVVPDEGVEIMNKRCKNENEEIKREKRKIKASD